VRSADRVGGGGVTGREKSRLCARAGKQAHRFVLLVSLLAFLAGMWNEMMRVGVGRNSSRRRRRGWRAGEGGTSCWPLVCVALQVAYWRVLSSRTLIAYCFYLTAVNRSK
jgi:hypothetical protein